MGYFRSRRQNIKLDVDKEDFPLKGFLGKAVTRLVSQRDPRLSDPLVKTNPGQTFLGLVGNILKEKNIARYSILGYFFESIFTGVYVLLPLILGQFVSLFLEDNTVSYGHVSRLVVIALAMLALAAGANFMGVCYADRIRGTGEALARRQLTWWALGHSAGWFSAREAGQIAHRIAEASRQIHMIFGFLVWDAFPAVMALLIVSVVMFATDFYAGLFFAFWAAGFLYLSITLGLVSQKFMMRTVKKRAEASGLVTDSLLNHSLVRLFNARFLEDKKVEAHSQRCYEAFIESSTWSRIKNLIRDVWIMFMVGAMILILGQGLLSERLTPAAFVGGMGTLFVLIAQIRHLHHVIRDLMEAVGAVRESLREIGTRHEIPEKEDGPQPALEDTGIALENLSFSYPNGKNVLRNIDLRVAEGQKLGVVGPSGAGKTTLMALLLRLWDVDEGAISIGGHNIKELPFDVLRRNMALIPQDTSLFHRSLMENIRYGRLDASDQDVMEASRKAHAHEFILGLPLGYHTRVGERGVKLSGGQRQRIAIARAILKDAPILILDEATSALDSESEKLIQDSLKELIKGKTVIAIAHRLSTIAHLDRLIVMDHGKIVEDGAHDELLKNNGLYARLWNMQSGGFLGE